MQYVKAKYITNGVITGGIDLWWSPGEKNYLYQEWRPGFSPSERIYSQINVDPMYGNDLRVVARESWNGEIVSYSPDYDG